MVCHALTRLFTDNSMTFQRLRRVAADLKDQEDGGWCGMDEDHLK